MRNLIFGLLLALSGNFLAHGADLARLPENRFLIIVETSQSMQRREANTVRAVRDMIASGMRGQAKAGDTLGVWTYNAALTTGEVPLQDLAPTNWPSVADMVAKALSRKRFSKTANFSKVMPVLKEVITESPYLTIILFTDGTQQISGTPFDSKINNLYDTWREEQQTANMPLITVLRTMKGSFTDGTVSPAPWPVEMPPLPPELTTPGLAQKKPVAAPPPQKPPPVMGQPLIISGRQQVTNESPVAVAAPAPNPEPSPVVKPVKPLETKPVAKTETAPAASAPAAPANPGQLAAGTPSKPPADPVPTPAPVPTPTPEPSAVTAPPIRDTAVKPPSPAPVATAENLIPSAATKSGPEPAVTAPPPKPREALPPAEVAPAAPTAPAPAAAKPESAPAVEVTIASAPSPAQRVMPIRSWVFVAAVAAIVVICLLILIRARRPKSAQASLITRSLNRDRPSE